MGERVTIRLDSEQREGWRRMFDVLRGRAANNLAPEGVSFGVERENLSGVMPTSDEIAGVFNRSEASKVDEIIRNAQSAKDKAGG